MLSWSETLSFVGADSSLLLKSMVILGPCKCCTVWQENYGKLLMFIPGLQFVKHANPCRNRLSAPGARARPKADDPMSRLGLHLRRTQESVAWNRQVHLRFL